jgi:hypothetical protein
LTIISIPTLAQACVGAVIRTKALNDCVSKDLHSAIEKAYLMRGPSLDSCGPAFVEDGETRNSSVVRVILKDSRTCDITLYFSGARAPDGAITVPAQDPTPRISCVGANSLDELLGALAVAGCSGK